MRASLAMVALTALLLASSARAGDESAPADLLKEMRAAQSQREKALAEPPKEEPLTLEGLVAKGDAERAKGDHPRALWSYLMAHRIDRSDPRPIGRIGTLHLSREPERAELIFRELVHRKGDSAIARTGLGLALIARGAWGEAVVELRKAADDDEALAATHNALGVALDHLKQSEAARWHYRRAAQLQPRSHEPLNNLGVSLLTSGDFANAAEAFESASRIEPRDAAVWNNLGVARGRLQQYDAALAAFRKAGDERSAWNNVGYVRYLNEDYDGALAAYERALHATGKPEERLPVLRNARAAQQAKARPPPRPKAQTPAPPAGSDAPGLGSAPGLLVEEVAPPAAMAEEPVAAAAALETPLETDAPEEQALADETTETVLAPPAADGQSNPSGEAQATAETGPAPPAAATPETAAAAATASDAGAELTPAPEAVEASAPSPAEQSEAEAAAPGPDPAAAEQAPAAPDPQAAPSAAE